MVRTGFIPSGQVPTTVTLNANSTTATLTIPIEDDDIDEADGNITVTINAPTNAGDYQVGTENSAQVSVSDNDEPLVTSTPANPPIATITTNAGYIEEGETIPIRIAITQIAPANGLAIRYRKSHTGNFFDSTFSGIATKKILAGETFVKFRIPVQDDDIKEANGTVTISLEDGSGYIVGNENSVSFKMIDNDGNPRVRISRHYFQLTEGKHSSNRIFFNSDRDVSEDTQINILVYGATNFLPADQIPTSVTILANSSKAVLEIPIDDDDVAESDGRIHVSILPPSSTDNYELWYFTSTYYIVRDDDEPADTDPEISVSTASNLISGSDGYLFRLTASHASEVDIIINVDVTVVSYLGRFSSAC